MIEKYSLSATTTGTTGSATGSKTSANVVSGKVHAVYFTCASGGTANITLSQQSAGENILNLTAVASSSWYYPRRELVTNAGSVSLNYEYDRYCALDYLSMNVTNATTAKTFQLDIYVVN